MQRYPYDMSHFSFMTGNIGSLQTLSCFNIMAGDSVEFNLEGVFRLSALRRYLVVDCHVDLFCFYVPHRHVYGDQWINFIKDGMLENETFPGVTAPRDLSYLGSEVAIGETMPLWRTAGYNRIWNRYFRSPTDLNERADDYVSPGGSTDFVGYNCGPLPTPWSTGVIAPVDPGERDVPVAGGVFDIVKLEQVKQQYKTDVDRTYFGQRYNDILNVAFGSRVNIDADERPLLCQHSKFWLSGYDVDGTADANLGTFVGKSVAVGGMSMRRKFFPEHGALWFMALLRWPTIHTLERPFLHTVVNPTYLQAAGDPAVVGAEPPENITSDMFFRIATNNDLGYAPFGQYYRYQPSVVHRDYQTVDGFTFMDRPITSTDTAQYIGDDEYVEVFQSSQLRNWQSDLKIAMQVHRLVPPARRSLYAGV